MAVQTKDTKVIRFYADVSSDCSELLVVVKKQKDNGWNQNEAKALKNSGGKIWSGFVSWNSCEFPVEYRYIAKLGNHHYWALNEAKTRDVPGQVNSVTTDTPQLMVRDDLYTIVTRTQPSNDGLGQEDLLKRFEAKFDDMEDRLEVFEANFDDMKGRLEVTFNERIASTCANMEHRIQFQISEMYKCLGNIYHTFETKSDTQRKLESHAAKFEEKIEQVLASKISEMATPTAAMTGAQAKDQQSQSSTPWSLFSGSWNSWASEVDATRQNHARMLEEQKKALEAASFTLFRELKEVKKNASLGLECHDDKLKELKKQVEKDLSSGLKKVDDKIEAMNIEEVQGQISQIETTLGQIDNIKKDLQSQLGQINNNRVELSNIRKKVNYLVDDFNELKEQFEAETSKRVPSDPVFESQTTPLEASADPTESELPQSQSSPVAYPAAEPPAKAPAPATPAPPAPEPVLPHQMPMPSLPQETEEAASGPAIESPSSASPTVPLQPPQRSPTSSEASVHVPPAPASSSSVPTQSSSSIPDPSMPPTPPLTSANQTSQTPPASAPAQGGGGSAFDAPIASHFEAEGLSPEKATAAVELCAIVLSQLKQAMMDYKLGRGEKPTSMTIKSQLLQLHSDKGGDSEIKDAAFHWFRKYWCHTLGHQAWYLRLVG